MTRSQSQKSTCKDLGRAGERAAITPKAIYAPVSNRAGSRFHKKSQHWAGQKQVWFL
ncbi:alpha-galactosidase [Lacticaseibacillus paracasei]|nr:alpha-galactosidase [Lacticaseibacillus paracasei]